VAAILLISLVFAVCVYRAATQSLAHDEALTYRIFLAGPASNIFTFYDANHHFLATILMRLSTALLGSSEFAVRLPSLAGAALYCWVAFRLSLALFPGSLAAVWSVLVLVTNPLLLDFLVAARGYGLAVALYYYSLWLLLTYLTAERKLSILYQAAVAVSCSVMANMTMVFPAFLLAVAFLATLPRPTPAEQPGKRAGRRAGKPPVRFTEMAHFVGPVLGCALVYWMAAPLTQVEGAMFQQPTTSIVDSVNSLVRASHAHNSGLGGINADGPVRQRWLQASALVLYPAVLLAAIVCALRSRQRRPARYVLIWSTTATAGSLLLYLLMHRAVRWPYPADRTGVYLLALFALVLVSLAAVLRSETSRWRFAAWPCLFFGGLLAASHIAQFNWTRFYVWPYDADDKRIVSRLESLRAGSGSPLSVGISWQLEPSFNYYRHSRNLIWLPPFDRSGPRGEHDYYVLIWNDRSLARERNLEILYEGPNSGTLLARSRQQSRP
jgi:hypothetical protein